MDKTKNFLTTTGGRIVMTVFFAAIIYGIILLCASMNSTIFALIVCIACGYFGWKALTRITPNMFLIMSVGKWAIYFIVKGILAVLIGMIVAPFVIAKMISNKISESIVD